MDIGLLGMESGKSILAPKYQTQALESISYILAFMWLYTGVNKIYDWGGMQYGVYAQSFPIWVAELIIYILPSLEILVGSMLLVTQTRRLALSISSVLMVVFTVYVAWVYFGGRGFFPCTCGGIFQQLNWGSHLLLNMVLLILSIVGYLLEWNRGSPVNKETRSQRITR